MNQAERWRSLASTAELLQIAAVADAKQLRQTLAGPAPARWSLRWFGRSPAWQISLLQPVATAQRNQAWLCLHDHVGTARTLGDWLDWLDGEEVRSELAPWPYGRLDPQARVSRHYLSVMRQLDDLADGRLRLLQALLALSEAEELIVAGHGRAGALASVLAPWLESQLGQRRRIRMRVQSFGAPTAGDWTFAQGLHAAYGMGEGRCLSRLDPMPYCWGGLGWLLSGCAGGNRLPQRLRSQLQRLSARLSRSSRQHCQPAGGMVLDALTLGSMQSIPGPARPDAGASDRHDDPASWVAQARREHELSSYRRRLGRLLASSHNELPRSLARIG